MTATTIEDVIRKHRQLTAQKAAMSAAYDEAVRPVSEKIEKIEMYLLAKMNQDGVQNYKTADGTAYQSKLMSVKCEDPIAFRNFVLAPAVDRILDVVVAMGATAVDKERDTNALLALIGELGLWDITDFRPGKKGIIKYQEGSQKAVPGVTLNQITNVNVRGS